MKMFLDLVLGTHADVGSTAVIVLMSDKIVKTEVGISKASHGIDGKRCAGGDDVVDVDVHVKGAHLIILEIIDKLGGNAPVGDGLILHLGTKSSHGILAGISKLTTYRDVTSLGASAKRCC